MKTLLEIDWKRDIIEDFGLSLKRTSNISKTQEYRDSTLDLYVSLISWYIKFVGTDSLSIDPAIALE